MSNSQSEGDDATPDSILRKPLIWIPACRKDYQQLPRNVQKTFGQALAVAQVGGKHPKAKVLGGFQGAGVLEVKDNDSGSTFRVVYTVAIAGVVYVLHAFQKKSKSGKATPAEEMDKDRSRFKEAVIDNAKRKSQIGDSE